ncbi:MAG: dipeptide ABC transporter ATP-binding protein [Candidatus Odinarchaeum yellowstonii]|uniref:Dipeptide ABC transporter ATP-binding protein n=1 Tax=Odinarchaeota yellowstonii (strain LCB_4) TaxID=1841599 RepID=A0AAF0D2D9_ODILC|nr:MAG: dipeptide ABC transporter ATP-binding protein [Candidatus Odinarchaeum yellowstonii]
MPQPLIQVKNLVKHFPIYGGVLLKQVGVVHAVDGVSFEINKKSTLGLVGESGCGKTTVGRCTIRLIEPTSGEIYYNGENILKLNKKELNKFRCRAQIVFQNPHASLNPRMKIKDILSEPIKIHKLLPKSEIESRVLQLINEVALEPSHLVRYPHEFSGGQKQRIVIARALAVNPEFIVLDEPTSALDVSVQAQILNLLTDLQQKFNLTYLFITHNLNICRHISDEIAVMYVGKIVEKAGADELFEEPLHPYTQALLSANPIPDPEAKRSKIILTGEVPSPINPPKGCRFHPRCPRKMEVCDKTEPPYIEVKPNHYVACYLYSK